MTETLSLLEGRPPVFLTNRFNLLHVLSAGFVPSLGAFDKYYEDLLARTPGRVVLFAGAVSPSIAALVEDTPQAFPVLVEVRWNPTTSTPSHEPDADGAPFAWAPEGAVGLPVEPVIHFRSEEERNEHRARQFANVPTLLDLRVSPELFSDARVEAESFSQWMAELPPPEMSDGRSAKALDRAAGGACLLAVARGRFRGPAAAHSVLQAFASSGGHWSVATALDRGGEAPSRLDVAVLEAAIDLIQACPPGQPPPALGLMQDLRLRMAGETLPEDQATALEQNLARAEVVLRAEEDLRPLKSGQGLLSVKAVLLAMLRRDPERLFGQAERDAGDDHESVETAALLIGVAYGRTMLPLEFRPPDLDAILVDHIVRTLSGSTAPTPASSARDRVLALDPSDDSHRVVMARVCQVMQWDDLVTSLVTGTTVAVEPGRVGRSTGVHMRLPGFASIRYEVDVAAFRRRILESPPGTLDEDELDRLLAEGPVRGRPRRRRARRPSADAPPD